MTPPKVVPSYKYYMTTGSKLRSGNLKIVGCCLCHANRTYDDGRSVYLTQLNRWPTLHVHLACYDTAVKELEAAFPQHPFVESLG